METNMTHPHCTYIDSLRGLAMLFVVMGHVFLFCFHYSGVVCDFVTIVELPLFFFISGYLAFKKEYDYKKTIVRKMKAILLPYICANLFMLFIRGFDVQVKAFGNAHWGTWFLMVLFEAFMIFYLVVFLLYKIKNKYIQVCFWVICLFLLVLCRFWFKNNPFISELLCYDLLLSYFPYLVLGYLFRLFSFEEMLKKKYVIDFFLVAWLFTFAFIMKYDSYANFITFAIVKISAIMTLWGIFMKQGSKSIFHKLSVFGKYSLEIYLIHFYMLFSVPAIGVFLSSSGANWSSVNVLCEFLFSFFISIVIAFTSILIAKFFMCSSVFRFCFGRK